MKAINIHTLEESTFTVDNKEAPPAERVYVAADGDRWNAREFLVNWRDEDSRDYGHLVARKIREAKK